MPFESPAAAAMPAGAVKAPPVSPGARPPAAAYQPKPVPPPAPPRPLAPPPRPVVPPPQPAGGGWNLGGLVSGAQTGIKKIQDAVTDRSGMLGYGMRSAATQQAPPLSHVTGALGSWKPTADAALGYVQKAIKDEPGASPDDRPGVGRFATYSAPLMKPMLDAAGPAGILGMAGLYGTLAGGDSYAALRRMLRPLLDGRRPGG